METLYAIGIDLGATKIASALVSQDGQILTRREFNTDAVSGPASVSERIANEINLLARQSPAKISGIGIGSPGLLDPSEGVVKYAVNLGWENVSLAKEIQNHLPSEIPIWLEKDANASALGEYYFGSSRGVKDSVYLGIGSGLGAGIIANGQLVAGTNGIAADVGHLSLDPQGRACACGLRGCIETVVSGPGLVNVVKDLSLQYQYPTQVLNDAQCLEPRSILAAAVQGDELAQRAFEIVGQWLGITIANIIMLLNPGVIVLGGGLGRAAFSLLLPSVKKEVNQRATTINLQNLQILPSRLSSSAVGAACLVWSGSGMRVQLNNPSQYGGVCS